MKQAAQRIRAIYPGPSPTFLIGNIPLLEANKKVYGTPAQAVNKFFSEYGDTFPLSLGPLTVLYTRDLDFIRFVINNDPEKFTKPQVDFLMKDILGQSIFCTEGEAWYRKRKLMRNAFKKSALEGFIPKLHLSAQEIAASWKRRQGEEINLLTDFQGLSMDIIGRVGFGVDFQCLNQPGKSSVVKDFDIIQQTSHKLEQNPVFLFLGSDFAKKYLKAGKQYVVARDRLLSLVNDNLKEREESDKRNEKKNDLLQYLIESSGEEIEEEETVTKVSTTTSPKKYTNSELVNEVILFYTAGYETTSNLLTWTLYYLSTHPSILEKVLHELKEMNVPSDETIPNWSYLNSLSYLTQVLKETLRLHPALSGFMRQTINDIEYKGKIIPANLMIACQTFSVHRDKRHYHCEDTEEFNPEHFNSENTKNRNPLSWQPFAAGPRNCIGMQLAMLEARTVLSYILPRFKFTSTSKAKIAERNTVMTSENIKMKIQPN